jgi:peptide/nickel transport system ATP-binding protein/oligopeptide transport system ATP-binding protein
MTSLLEVAGLSKTFRHRRGLRTHEEHQAVQDVAFALDRGRTLAIVGESGAGKSTTARLVLRLIEPDAGTIHFDGTDLRGLSSAEMRRQRRHMQMIFQDPYSALDPRITIGHSVAEPLKVHFHMNRSDREQIVVRLLGRVGLGQHHLDRLPSELSGGQLQRVSIARALTVDPLLIVCDEAVSALDVSIRAEVLNLLLDIQEERKVSYLFIAHDLAIVEAFADDVIVMRNGAVVEAGSIGDVFTAPTSPYTKELLAAIPVPDPSQRRGDAQRNEPAVAR